jgi:hypothetical protein
VPPHDRNPGAKAYVAGLNYASASSRSIEVKYVVPVPGDQDTPLSQVVVVTPGFQHGDSTGSLRDRITRAIRVQSGNHHIDVVFIQIF